MSFTAVLIDDEKKNVDNLTKMLELNCPEIFVCATAKNAEKGKEIIIKYRPEIVFLDISMPSKTGFDLLKGLDNCNFELIFVTAYEHYAIQAIKFAAIDYLLKPINASELKSAVNRAIERKKANLENLKLNNLMSLIKAQNERRGHRVALVTLKETRFINTHDIIRCESSNNYTSFYIKGGEKIVVSKPIYEYEEILAPYGFVRCHQSHLVNLDYIKSWLKIDGDYLLLEDKSQIPISKAKKGIVTNALRNTNL